MNDDTKFPLHGADVHAAPRTPPRSRANDLAANDDTRFPFQHLDVYRAARQLAAAVHDAHIADAELRDQATRAAKSAFLNLCEGLPDFRAAMRRKYFVQADGSLHETVGAVDLAAAIGALGAGRAAEIQALAHRVRGMLRGLIRASARAA